MDIELYYDEVLEWLVETFKNSSVEVPILMERLEEVFIKASGWIVNGKLLPDLRIKGYLKKAAKRSIINYLKKPTIPKNNAIESLQEQLKAHPKIEKLGSWLENRRDIKNIKKLLAVAAGYLHNPNQTMVVLLRDDFFGGLSNTDAAKLLGLETNTTSQDYGRGIQAMIEHIFFCVEEQALKQEQNNQWTLLATNNSSQDQRAWQELLAAAKVVLPSCDFGQWDEKVLNLATNLKINLPTLQTIPLIKYLALLINEPDFDHQIVWEHLIPLPKQHPLSFFNALTKLKLNRKKMIPMPLYRRFFGADTNSKSRLEKLKFAMQCCLCIVP